MLIMEMEEKIKSNRDNDGVKDGFIGLGKPGDHSDAEADGYIVPRSRFAGGDTATYHEDIVYGRTRK